MKQKVDIFFCYARKDQTFLEELKMHLMPLQRLGLINVWHDMDISPGKEWEEEIREHLNTAHIILLLISANFMASEYCYSKEMVWAMGRHEHGEARVIPVILRPVIWQEAPFGKLQALPKDALPVTRWSDRDDALFHVAGEIKKTAEALISSWERAAVRQEKQKQPVENMSFPSLPGSEMGPWPLHFIWILDCSSSMMGDKIQSLNRAIREIFPELKSVASSNPQAQILVRAITFSSGARWHIAQPTPIDQLRWTDVTAGGKRDMGKALQMVADELEIPPMNIRNISPVLVLVANGYPTDDAMQGIRAILDQPWGRVAVRIGIGIGADAPYELLQNFIGDSELKPLQANNAAQLVDYIRWADETVVTKHDVIPEEFIASKPVKGNIPDLNIPTPPPRDPHLSADVW